LLTTTNVGCTTSTGDSIISPSINRLKSGEAFDSEMTPSLEEANRMIPETKINYIHVPACYKPKVY